VPFNRTGATEREFINANEANRFGAFVGSDFARQADITSPLYSKEVVVSDEKPAVMSIVGADPPAASN
jgi:hypothetical protein